MTPHHRPPRPEEENIVENEIVEQVAKALCDEDLGDAPRACSCPNCPCGEAWKMAARAAIDAHVSALSAAGLVIVPREATDDMLCAAQDASPDRPTYDAADIYRAMIAASSPDHEEESK